MDAVKVIESLPESLIALVAWVSNHVEKGLAAPLLAQVHLAVVTREVLARILDAELPSSAVSHVMRVGDGPLKPIPGVVDEGEVMGEFMVWVRDGLFTGLEQSWITDEPPAAWPEVWQLRL
jgi:hypothetical protein